MHWLCGKNFDTSNLQLKARFSTENYRCLHYSFISLKTYTFEPLLLSNQKLVLYRYDDMHGSGSNLEQAHNGNCIPGRWRNSTDSVMWRGVPTERQQHCHLYWGYHLLQWHNSNLFRIRWVFPHSKIKITWKIIAEVMIAIEAAQWSQRCEPSNRAELGQC